MIGRGTDPSDPAVQALARRFSDLMLEVSGMLDGGPAAALSALSTEVWRYLQRAFGVGYATSG